MFLQRYNIPMTPNATPAAKQLFKQALTYLASQDIRSSVRISHQLVNSFPDYADGWFALSQSSLALGKLALALKCIYKALSLDSKNAVYYVQLGRCFRNQGCLKEALQAADRANDLEPENAAELDALGTLYSQCGEYSSACSLYERAVEKVPDNADYQFNLGSSLQAIGQMNLAEQAYEEALKLSPDSSDVKLSLARLRTQTPGNNHIESLLSAIGHESIASLDEVRLCYALAKEYEDVGDHEKSFSYLKRGSDKKRVLTRYNINQDLDLIDYLIEVFSEGLFHQVKTGYDNDEPIFIVGMPRSGTTLVERIVSSHGDVFAAGELHNFRHSMMHETRYQAAYGYIDRVLTSRALQCDLAAVGKRYIASTRPRTGHTKHFIDKLPMNALCVGLIHLALPHAKIIELVRDPIDVCFSNYKMLFKQGYEYSYDLQELGKFYIAYNKLMQHWQKIMPGKVLRISYENLVESQEQESRRLIDFCGLKWENACLEFHQNKEPSATASSAQVRKPMYRTAIGRWRNYQEQLQPLIEILRTAGIIADNE